MVPATVAMLSMEKEETPCVADSRLDDAPGIGS